MFPSSQSIKGKTNFKAFLNNLWPRCLLQKERSLQVSPTALTTALWNPSQSLLSQCLEGIYYLWVSMLDLTVPLSFSIFFYFISRHSCLCLSMIFAYIYGYTWVYIYKKAQNWHCVSSHLFSTSIAEAESLWKSGLPAPYTLGVQLPQIFCLCISSAGIQACPTFIWMLYFELSSSWLFSKCIITK